MDQFEYKVVQLRSGKAGFAMGGSLERQLNKLGADGWDLAFIVARKYRSDKWVFRRRVA